MNNLMCFEGHQIEIIKENGEWLFEIYSTGMALGYVKFNSLGKAYARKERIDETIKNADITPCVQHGHNYFTEPQLYDFMLEAKTEKVKPFRKWLVNEVLPAINHAGTYSVKKEPKQLKLEEKPYKYIPKLYKGEPVVTAADLEHFTGINRSNFSYYRKKYTRRFQIGVDFWYLNGEALRDFKEETHINPLTNCLILYSKSGVMKLSKIMSGVPAELPCLCDEAKIDSTKNFAHHVIVNSLKELQAVNANTIDILEEIMNDEDKNKEIRSICVTTLGFMIGIMKQTTKRFLELV